MFAAWSVCAVLFAIVFGARAAPLEDDRLIEKVKKMITEMEDFLNSRHLNEFRFSDIDFPSSPVKIKNIGIGDLSTIQLQDGSSVTEEKSPDHTITYTFNIKLGLEKLRFHYDLQVNSADTFQKEGNFSLSILDNSAELTGYAIVVPDKSCFTKLSTLKVLRYGDYHIALEPEYHPAIAALSEEVLDFITPLVLPFGNGALQASLEIPEVQQKFSEFACYMLSTL